MSYVWLNTVFNPFQKQMKASMDLKQVDGLFFNPKYFQSDGLSIPRFMTDIYSFNENSKPSFPETHSHSDRYAQQGRKIISELMGFLAESLQDHTGYQSKALENPYARHYGMLAAGERDLPGYILQAIVLSNAVLQPRNAELRASIDLPAKQDDWVKLIAASDIKFSSGTSSYGLEELMILEEAARKVIEFKNGDICPIIGAELATLYCSATLSGLPEFHNLETILPTDAKLRDDHVRKYVIPFLTKCPSVPIAAGIDENALNQVSSGPKNPA